MTVTIVEMSLVPNLFVALLRFCSFWHGSFDRGKAVLQHSLSGWLAGAWARLWLQDGEHRKQHSEFIHVQRNNDVPVV